MNWRPGVRDPCGVEYGKWCLLTWVEDGSTCKLYDNGVLKVTFTGGAAPQWGTQTMILGNSPRPSAYGSIEGHIAMVLVYSTALSDVQKDEG